MKTLILSLSLLLVTFNSFAYSDKNLSTDIQTINAAEAVGNYKFAALYSANAANRIADELKFDEVITSIESTLNEEREEVVTSTKKKKAGLSLFGLASASASQRYDTTKILITNSDEVAAFSRQQAKAFSKLQTKLQSFVEKNSRKISYAKLFVARALELSAKLPIERLREVYETVTVAAQRVSTVSFLGTQTITHCISTEHERSLEKSRVSLQILFAGFSAEEKTINHSYDERSCETETVNVREIADSTVELMLADEALENMSQILSMKILREQEAPVYPTWGSPVIQN